MYKVCTVDGCQRETVARDMCMNHYYQARRRGDFVPAPYGARAVDQRWAEAIAEGTTPEFDPSLGPCLVWTGTLRKGYGRFFFDGHQHDAHRVAWEREYGPVPDGIRLDHRCHVKRCVRLGHLRLVSNKQNLENQVGPRRDKVSSRYRGVFWRKGGGTWRVQVRHNGKLISGGEFPADQEDAAGEAARLLRLQLFTHNDADRR